jgi:glutamate--cysteine ligase
MELKCKRPPYNIDKHVLALSIRNSCYGYQNLGELYPDFSSVRNYKQSIEQMVHDQKITSARELYSSVRPKFIDNPDHISYIEIRFIDIDPMVKVGITEKALYFLHTLVLYGLFTNESDSFNEENQALANKYHGYVSHYGLNNRTVVQIEEGEYIDLWKEARIHIKEIKTMLKKLEIDKSGYNEAVDTISKWVENPNQRGVFDVLDGVLKEGYIHFHLKLAQQYLSESKKNNYQFYGLEDMELSTRLLLREAVKRGVAFDILDRKENFIRLSKNDNIQYVKQATKTSLDNYASILAMENKLVTKKILESNNIRVPNGFVYTHAEAAKSDFSLLKNKSVVIKPNQTNFGIGVSILKENSDEVAFKRAIDIAFANDNTILIEEFVKGKEYRFFVIDNEVVGILHRVPANITGDGEKTIRELVQIKNMDPLRGKGYLTPLEKIQLGEPEEMFLSAQHKSFDYIPKNGETVFLRENSNISTGGDSIDFTDEIPDSYKQIAIKAASALQVRITGLDMMIDDYTQEASIDNYSIIEMNFNPAIHIHCHPYKGKNRKLNEKLMDALGYKNN